MVIRCWAAADDTAVSPFQGSFLMRVRWIVDTPLKRLDDGNSPEVLCVSFAL